MVLRSVVLQPLVVPDAFSGASQGLNYFIISLFLSRSIMSVWGFFPKAAN